MTRAKILVVDDEPQFERLVLQRFRRKVRSKEYDFVFAQNGIQALEKLENNQDVDIILTDINMPQMDGLTFLTRLNEKESSIKAVMVSAYGDMENIRAAMNRGAFDFVTKPIDFDDLEITINKAVKEIHTIRTAENTKAKLYSLQQELAIASEIQQSFLPNNEEIFPENFSYDLSAKMKPAKEVGGDLFDYFFVDDDHLALVIGDVAGKGMPAALFMAVTRTLIRAHGPKNKDVGQCMNQVNHLLSEDNPTMMFVTVFYSVLNIRTGELEYCSAGHNPPILQAKDNTLKYLDANQNVALGIVHKMDYKTQRTIINPGERLVLYTDGVTEAANKDHQFFEEHRLEAVLKEHPDANSELVLDQLIERVEQFSFGLDQSDDITAMIIKRLD